MQKKPTLLIDTKKVQQNISRMFRKAVRSNTVFRPHFKTHQSADIGELFRQQGIHKITVSSVSMAVYFAKHGWNDITIAFPVNLRETEEINELAGRIRLNILVDSVYSTQVLAGKIQNSTGVLIEFDNGYHRSGLLPDEMKVMDEILSILKQDNALRFNGFLTHAGNTYTAGSTEEILSIMKSTATQLQALKEKYSNRFPDVITSYGDTPSCSIADDLSSFDEIRPGNFVYYDVMQYHIGSCQLDDIAVAVACPVVSVYPKRKEIVIYGGAVHLSKEFIAADNNFKLFGYVVNLTEDEWSEPIPGAYVSSISQEHGIVKIPEQFIGRFQPGETVGILPIHSCLTADLLKDSSIIF